MLFRKICQTKSISKAAEQNYISRSSLSGIISAMEKELGFKLLKRSKKGIVLTDKGQMVYEQAENICNTYEKWLRWSEDFSAIKGTVVFGVNSFYSRELINNFILKCNTLYPDITLLLSVIPPGRNDLLFKGLREHTLSFIYTPMSLDEILNIESENYSVNIMCKSQTKIIMRKEHPLAKKNYLDLAELKKLTYIFPAYDYGDMTTKIIPYFEKAIRYIDTSGILSCVAQSDFVTSLAVFSLVNVEIDKYAMLSCKEIEDVLAFSVVSPQEKNMTLAERKVREVFQNCFGDFLKSLPEDFVKNEVILTKP